MKNVLLIDGNSFFYRSYYASIKFVDKENDHFSGVYTAIRMFKKFLNNNSYSKIFFTFDLGKKTTKHQKWAKYKINRKKTPDDLIKQIAIFEDFLIKMQIDFFKHSDFEADDLLASLAKKMLKHNFVIDVISSDRDLLQIVEKNVNLFLIKTGVSQMDKVDVNNFFTKYQIYSWQMNDFKALVGDYSDNLPGVKGIGPQTAKKLINDFKNIETIYENLEQIPKNVKEKLIKFKNDAFLTKEMSEIKNDIPLSPNLKEQSYNFYSQPLLDFYKKYKMFSLLKHTFKQTKFDY